MQAGFYKYDGSLMHATTFVKSPSFELHVDTKDTHTYPTDGWYWFDTLEEACTFCSLNIADYLPGDEQ